jgi:hypothetical protein
MLYHRIFSGMADTPILPTLFEFSLSVTVDPARFVNKPAASNLQDFFRTHPLFTWDQNHNGCEARADAVCLLLDSWGIPNYKAWVFSGRFLKKHVGELKQNWKYHVAALLPVMEEGQLRHYVIDPSTSDGLQTLYDWAANVTEYAHSYHFVKEAYWYIFHDKQIQPDNWHARDRRNRKWMIQGLANINGLNARGKAALTFNKGRIKNTAESFRKLLQQSPQPA